MIKQTLNTGNHPGIFIEERSNIIYTSFDRHDLMIACTDTTYSIEDEWYFAAPPNWILA